MMQNASAVSNFTLCFFFGCLLFIPPIPIPTTYTNTHSVCQRSKFLGLHGFQDITFSLDASKRFSNNVLQTFSLRLQNQRRLQQRFYVLERLEYFVTAIGSNSNILILCHAVKSKHNENETLLRLGRKTEILDIEITMKWETQYTYCSCWN